MKFLRRSLMLAALLTALVCAVLLLNFTAPNPTGRRYSSETPLRTREGASYQLGVDGERVLANDLGLPNNNASGQGQCFCRIGNDAGFAPKCRICVGQFEAVSRARVPDFVTPTLIVDSKNSQHIPSSSEEAQEIADYAMLAQLTSREFWLFVRMDTTVSLEVAQIVQLTGGDLVYYFTTPDYVDPVDQTARAGFAGAGILFGFVGWLELRSWRGQKRLKLLSSKPKPTAPPKYPNNPLNRAIHKTDAAADFGQRAIDRQRRDIDRDSL